VIGFALHRKIVQSRQLDKRSDDKRSEDVMKTFKTLVIVIVLVFSVVGCGAKAPSATETPVPASITEPTAQADAVVGDWQGTPLTESALRARMAKAGWEGLVDYVTEDVSGYGHVSRLIFGGIAEEQAHALEVAEAVAKEFGGVLWFMYGAVGSGFNPLNRGRGIQSSKTNPPETNNSFVSIP